MTAPSARYPRIMARAASGAVAGALVLTACGPQAPAAETNDAPPAARNAEAAAGRPAVRPESRTFRDWRVSCDNGADCFAFGPAVEGGTGWVRVHMPAGPQARPDVRLGFWAQGDGAGALKVAIDGRDLAVSAQDLEETWVVLADPAAAATALAAGRGLTLSRGGETQALSLNGASAALLWIDERQGRLDTTTALVRRGDRPASAVPAAPVLPVVTPAPAADQSNLPTALPAALAGRDDVVECRAEMDHLPQVRDAVSRARLDARTELWGVPCGAGAYNLSTQFFLTGPDGADPRPLAFSSTLGEPQELLTNAEYDPDTRQLSQFAKGRGLGDCGVIQSWTWTGREFTLSQDTVMGECWGVPGDLWPTAWRTRPN